MLQKSLYVCCIVLFAASFVLAQGSLVAHYSFEGNFDDISANHLNAIPHGDAKTIYDPDRGSTVVSLDGGGDYVDLGNDTLFNWQGGWTAAFWVKLRNWDEGWDTFLKKNDSYSFERNITAEQLSFYHWPNWTGTSVDLTPDGKWHHIAATLDGMEQKIFIDGQLWTSVNNAGNFAKNENPVILGSAGGTGRFIDASFDDLRLYRAALSEQNIKELYKEEKSTGLVACFNFDTDFQDVSGRHLQSTPHGDASIVYDQDRGGNVVTLDGDGDYVDLGNDSLFNWQGGWTAAFWVKLRNWDEGWDTFLKKNDSYSFERNVTAEQLSFYHWPNWTGTSVDLTPDGKWHHIAATLDGMEQKIFIDGQLWTSVNNAGNFAKNENPVILGSAGGTGRFIDASFDDIRLYAAALPDDEIKKLAKPNISGYLVAHYSFDGNFNDASGNNLKGTPHGDAATIYDAERDNQVVTLDGDGDYVELGNNALFNWQGAWTAAFWVKLRNWDEGWDTFLKKNDAFSFERDITSDNLAFYHWPNWSGTDIPLTADNQWHHIAATLDGSKQEVYLDGLPVTSVQNAGAFAENTNPVILGSAGGTSRFIDASFDELQIYRIALNEDQIKDLAGYVPTSTLAAHYTFNSDFSDSSGNGLNGAPKGDAAIVYDSDRQSNVLALDGDGDYVDLGKSDLYKWKGGWSAAFWLKLTGWTGANDTFLKKDGSYSIGREDANDKLEFLSWPDATGAIADFAADGSWHHITATLDGTTKNLYIDGYLIATAAAGAFANNGNSVILGSSNGTDSFVQAYFDDVRLYNEAISIATIRELAGTKAMKGNVLLLHFDGDLVNSAPTGGTAEAGGNVSFVDGIPGMGQAAYLDNDAESDTSYLSFPAIPELSMTSGMTIQGWFKYADTTSSNWNSTSYLFSKVDSRRNFNYQVWTSLVDTTINGAYQSTEMGGYVSDPTATVTFPGKEAFLNQWYHFTFQRDSVLKVVSLAITNQDGELVSFSYSQSHPAYANPVTSNLPLLIGRKFIGAGNYFNGYIDEFSISNVLEQFDLPPVILYPNYLSVPDYSQKIGNQDENLPNYPVNVYIAVLGTHDGVTEAKVRYHTVTNPYEKVATTDPRWQEVSMQKGVDDLYTGLIPKHPFGTVIDYYIVATSTTGKISTSGAYSDSTYERFGVWRKNDQVLKLSFEEEDLSFTDSTPYKNQLVTLGDWVLWDDPADQIEGNYCAYLPEGSFAFGEIISPFLSSEQYTVTAWVRPEPASLTHNTYIISNTPDAYNSSHTPVGPWWNPNYTFLSRYGHIKNDVVHENRWPGEFPWHGDYNYVVADTLGKWTHYMVNCGPDSIVVQRNDENDQPVERDVYKGPLGNGWEHEFLPIAPSRNKFRIGPPGEPDASPFYTGYLDAVQVYNYQTYPGNFAKLPTKVNHYTDAVPLQYQLFQNYPNPFNPTTKITFTLPKNQQVTLKVYDVMGRLTKTLVSRVMPSGEYTMTWDGTNEAGNKVSSGVYFYRLHTDGFTQTNKMMYLK
jgi:hypothetical protein